MWKETKIEKLLKKELSNLDSSVLNHDKFYRQYEQVRGYMCEEIYSNIARTEPDLTDHGDEHIKNVLINTYELIKYSIDGEYKYTPLELYVLCSAILIHDIGNINGRKEHEDTLSSVYNLNPKLRGIDSVEKRIVAKIATSHGGDENAISNLSGFEHISGKEIQSQCISGVLRFADELAEGPQRTSQYMLDNNMISIDSQKYHQYADISEQPAIKKDTIILKYNIVASNFLSNELEALLLLLYSRIYKLNRERINCGIYSKHVRRIKKVAITINFYKKISDIDAIDVADKDLTTFELNNLNCNRIKKCQVKEKYTTKLMQALKKHCKVKEKYTTKLMQALKKHCKTGENDER